MKNLTQEQKNELLQLLVLALREALEILEPQDRPADPGAERIIDAMIAKRKAAQA